jgi:hypothetical protein
MKFNNTAQHLNETCKRVVFPLPLRPNIKPKLQKIPEFQKKNRRYHEKKSNTGKLPFLPKREANFIQQVLFGSRRPMGNFCHLKRSVIQYVWPLT